MKKNAIKKEELVDRVLIKVEDKEEFFRQIYKNSISAIFAFDAEGIVKFLNQSAEHLFDIPAENMIDKPFRLLAFIDKPCEVEIVRPGKDTRIAEMQTLEIKLSSGVIFVSSLRDITELVRLREELRAVAFIDELSGLFNHQGFLVLAQQQLKIAGRNRKWLFFLVAEVNHVKWIKDAFGEVQGDQVLVDTSDIFKQVFRNSDIIARFGLNQFAALALEAHYTSSQLMVARLLQTIEDYNIREKRLYKLSLSLGTAFFDPDHPCSVEELISRAEASLQAHKMSS